MNKHRLEALSDGVLAIVITIMVLEFRATGDSTAQVLREMWPNFLCYVLSFIFVGIYWNNHHHMLQASQRVDGRVLWANLTSMFWLTLIPFFTAWVGRTMFAPLPVAMYGVVLFSAACAYTWLSQSLIALHGHESLLARAVGGDFKGKLSLAIYAAAILAALVQPMISIGLYVLVAVIWLIPDRRIVAVMKEDAGRRNDSQRGEHDA